MPKAGTILITTITTALTTHTTGEATTMESAMPESDLRINNSIHVTSEISEEDERKLTCIRDVKLEDLYRNNKY